VVGPLDVTLESLAAGGAIALRVVVVMMAFAVLSACVNPDALLRLLRPLARRSALTATLIGRLVPLAAADYRRLAEASELRGPGAEPVTRAALARRLVAGALDRSLDAAATLELRGYSLPGSATPSSRRPHRQARAVLAAATAIAVVAIAARAAGLGGFDPYPSLQLEAGAADLALALALPLIAAAPLLSVRRGEIRARRMAAIPGGAGG
jgi:energy-coupling factor transporter transmembrane protein EcfT